MFRYLKKNDPEIAESIFGELKKQHEKIQLIASENYVSRTVLEAAGSIMTNKYAEGRPGKRYYGGCEWVDVTERLAMERACRLFGANYADVQPHSGAQANMAAYFATIKPGDTIMGLNLSHGGHLSHGSRANSSGKLYNVVAYNLNPETEMLDYDMIAAQVREVKPKVIITGYSAYPRTIDFNRFRLMADEVGAVLIADIAHIAGLIAAELHPSSIHAAHITTTTTHKTLRGPRGGMVMTNDEETAKSINKAVFPGMQGGPLMHVIAAKAVAFKEAMTPEFKKYQQQILANAHALAKGLTDRGFRLTSGGTDNHLMLVDLTDKNVTGKEAEEALGKAGIVCNKNTIPNETRSPFVTSGVRLGTPSVTTRDMKEPEMDIIADLIARAIDARDQDAELEKIAKAAVELCEKFPLYADLRAEYEAT